jgi:Spy/CpxP family protein refolding chaperone
VARELRSHRVSVSLTEHDRQALERIAERSDLSLSRIVHEAVREFIRLHANEKVDVLKSRHRARR